MATEETAERRVRADEGKRRTPLMSGGRASGSRTATPTAPAVRLELLARR